MKEAQGCCGLEPQRQWGELQSLAEAGGAALQASRCRSLAPQSLVQAVKAIADIEGVSVSTWIRTLVIREVERRHPPITTTSGSNALDWDLLPPPAQDRFHWHEGRAFAGLMVVRPGRDRPSYFCPRKCLRPAERSVRGVGRAPRRSAGRPGHGRPRRLLRPAFWSAHGSTRPDADRRMMNSWTSAWGRRSDDRGGAEVDLGLLAKGLVLEDGRLGQGELLGEGAPRPQSGARWARLCRRRALPPGAARHAEHAMALFPWRFFVRFQPGLDHRSLQGSISGPTRGGAALRGAGSADARAWRT